MVWNKSIPLNWAVVCILLIVSTQPSISCWMAFNEFLSYMELLATIDNCLMRSSRFKTSLSKPSDNDKTLMPCSIFSLATSKELNSVCISVMMAKFAGLSLAELTLNPVDSRFRHSVMLFVDPSKVLFNSNRSYWFACHIPYISII